MFKQILGNFPQKHLRLAFAYGSGVFQQHGHKDMSKNMVDLIYVVDDPVAWHKENFVKNKSHYSFLKYFGHKYVAHVQEKYGAYVYYNTLVPCEGRMIKYGVISTQDMLADLLDWDTLYVAGRLHKPVNIIHDDATLSTALLTNLTSAVHTALLLLPPSFSEHDLYTTITGLSYAGDFRMKVGEDQNKISNIVAPNVERFRQLYAPILSREEHLFWHRSQGIFEQSMHHLTRSHHLNFLPRTLCQRLVSVRNKDRRHRDVEEVLKSYSYDSDCDEYVHASIMKVVQRSSLSQSIKGIFTAGFVKSVQYSTTKLKKMWRSKKLAKNQ